MDANRASVTGYYGVALCGPPPPIVPCRSWIRSALLKIPLGLKTNIQGGMHAVSTAHARRFHDPAPNPTSMLGATCLSSVRFFSIEARGQRESRNAPLRPQVLFQTRSVFLSWANCVCANNRRCVDDVCRRQLPRACVHAENVLLLCTSPPKQASSAAAATTRVTHGGADPLGQTH